MGAARGSTEISPGDLLVVYGREECMKALDQRSPGEQGDEEHESAVRRQRLDGSSGPDAGDP